MTLLAPPPGAVETAVQGEPFWLLPQRVAWWPGARTMLAADLHWGKGETFRAHGIPVPHAAFEEDFARLADVCADLGAERLLVLGDLIHHGTGLTPDLIAQIAAWRPRLPERMVLVKGNHDRHGNGELFERWGIDVVPEPYAEGPFAFCHHPDLATDGFVWAGHVHPAVRVNLGGAWTRFPCFVVEKRRALLPAFGSFTGAHTLKPKPSARYFAVANGQVVALSR